MATTSTGGPIYVPRIDRESLPNWPACAPLRYGVNPQAVLTRLGISSNPQTLLALSQLVAGDPMACTRAGLDLDPDQHSARLAQRVE